MTNGSMNLLNMGLNEADVMIKIHPWYQIYASNLTLSFGVFVQVQSCLCMLQSIFHFTSRIKNLRPVYLSVSTPRYRSYQGYGCD